MLFKNYYEHLLESDRPLDTSNEKGALIFTKRAPSMVCQSILFCNLKNPSQVHRYKIGFADTQKMSYFVLHNKKKQTFLDNRGKKL